MSKRGKKNNGNQSQQPAAVESVDNAAVETVTVEATETETPVEATVETEIEAEVTAEPVVADDVLAMLAGDDEPTATEGTTVADPDADAIDAEEPTDDEVLATINKAGSKSNKAPKAPKAAPVVMREFTAVAMIDDATLKANLDGCNAKKVREKADNLIAAIQSGKSLSRYTKVGVRQLVANGAISGKDMTSAFLAEGLSEGTARAQAQQQTALFKLVGAVVADPSTKGRLVANDAGLIKELAALAA